MEWLQNSTVGYKAVVSLNCLSLFRTTETGCNRKELKTSKNDSACFYTPTQGNYASVGSSIVAIAIDGRGGWVGLSSTVAI